MERFTSHQYRSDLQLFLYTNIVKYISSAKTHLLVCELDSDPYCQSTCLWFFAQREAPDQRYYSYAAIATRVCRTDEVLHCVRLSVPCLRFAHNRNSAETYNLLDT